MSFSQRCPTTDAQHLLPIAAELDDVRWRVGEAAWPVVEQAGFTPTRLPREGEQPADLTVVAAHADLRRCAGAVAMLEHGAGQTYRPASSANPGGPGRGRARLFLHPSEIPAARDRDAYPQARSVAIGSPWLEQLAAIPPPAVRDVVAFTWHWSCSIAPEARGDWQGWRLAVQALATDRRVLVHAHPRIRHEVAAWCGRTGLEFVPDFRELVARAWLLVCDNSSALFEWAALDRPVVVLQQPWYGDETAQPHPWPLRSMLGPLCFAQDQVRDAVHEGFADARVVRERRRAASGRVYCRIAGAARMAADEIRRLV